MRFDARANGNHGWISWDVSYMRLDEVPKCEEVA